MKPTVPAKWSYTASVKRMKAVVWKWKNLSVQMLGELWTAHEALARQGERTDLSVKAGKSWEDYCNDIGLNRTTAWRWLQSYDPVGRKLIAAEPEKPEKPVKKPAPARDFVANETRSNPEPAPVDPGNGDAELFRELAPRLSRMGFLHRLRVAARIVRGTWDVK